jgi:two-component system, NtrC family, nitrogen regulation response regulator GlnG
LPALRERREDIPMLTRFFLQKSAKELGVDAKRITEGALQRLAGFDFPGNVRQLENICHWLTVMAPAQVIEAKDLPPELGLSAVSPPAAAAAPAVSDATGGAGEDTLYTPLHTPQHAPLGSAALLSAATGFAGAATPTLSWLSDLEREARRLLESGDPEVWDALTRQFEAKLIHTALEVTRGRRIEAAQRLGIGRNTITRKIQELGLDD